MPVERVVAVARWRVTGPSVARLGGPHSRARSRASTSRYDLGPCVRSGLLLLVDLDGVLYRGADPVPGVAAVLRDRVRRAATTSST